MFISNQVLYIWMRSKRATMTGYQNLNYKFNFKKLINKAFWECLISLKSKFVFVKMV